MRELPVYALRFRSRGERLPCLALSGTPTISTEGRRLGTAFAVASSACALAFEYVVSKAESGLIFGKPWEIDAIAVVNTVIINAPQMLLFITLTLLASQSTGEQTSLVPESENV
jgi:hypothetical protein